MAVGSNLDDVAEAIGPALERYVGLDAGSVAVATMAELLGPSPVQTSPTSSPRRGRKVSHVSVLDRKTYQKEISSVAECLLDLDQKIGNREADAVRVQYAKDLNALKRQGVIIDVAAEVAKVPSDPRRAQKFAEQRLDLIRTSYQKNASATAGYAGSLKPRIKSQLQQRQAVAYAMENKVTLEAAAEALGF